MKKVCVIVGATAIGKTSLSIDIAKTYGCEIISGDSVQVYKGLDVGSAKIKESEKEGIKHHLIDIIEPGESYDVLQFQTHARALIDKIERPLIVGGTGLYIKAALDDYDFSGQSRDIKKEALYDEYSNEELHKLLEKLDFEASKKIHPNNRRRILRAIFLSNSKKRSERTKKDEPIYDYQIFYLTMDRKTLYDRINMRVDMMLEEGLIEEVKSLREKGYTFNMIGYREINLYLSGELTLIEAVELIKRNTRRLAKRQETWFKNQMTTHMIDVSDHNIAKRKIKAILDEFWEDL